MNLNDRARLLFGRNLDAGEIEQRMIHSQPEERTALIERVGAELEKPDISIGERAKLLGLKMRLNSIHQRMLRAYR